MNFQRKIVRGPFERYRGPDMLLPFGIPALFLGPFLFDGRLVISPALDNAKTLR